MHKQRGKNICTRVCQKKYSHANIYVCKNTSVFKDHVLVFWQVLVTTEQTLENCPGNLCVNVFEMLWLQVYFGSSSILFLAQARGTGMEMICMGLVSFAVARSFPVCWRRLGSAPKLSSRGSGIFLHLQKHVCSNTHQNIKNAHCTYRNTSPYVAQSDQKSVIDADF